MTREFRGESSYRCWNCSCFSDTTNLRGYSLFLAKKLGRSCYVMQVSSQHSPMQGREWDEAASEAIDEVVFVFSKKLREMV